MKPNPPVELTNEQRSYLGLAPVEESWELVSFEGMYLYYDKDTIRKKIVATEDSYYEAELCEHTADNRTILLPKTERGKPKKMNYTASLSFSPFGVYFYFGANDVTIANYTTHTTFFHDANAAGVDLKEWINDWIGNSTPKDMEEIQAFRNAKRQHVKYREGDFFAFRIGRREWGFGRIVLDIVSRHEALKRGKNHGLLNLMGKSLLIMLYRKRATSYADIDTDQLSQCATLPVQAIMDNRFYYGEYPIIGHKPVSPEEWEPIISYGQSINHEDKNTVYLQYGLIYRETTVDRYDKYLICRNPDCPSGYDINPYRMERIGFGIDNYDNIRELIDKGPAALAAPAGKRHDPDLRSPGNKAVKHEIFTHFGLDASKSYAENLKICSAADA